jgi:hypothetical protein
MLQHLRGAVVVDAIDQEVAGASGCRLDGPILAHVIVGYGPDRIIIVQPTGANVQLSNADMHPKARTLVFADCRGYGRSSQLLSTGAADEWLRDAQRLANWLEWQSFRIVTGFELLAQFPPETRTVSYARPDKSGQETGRIMSVVARGQ